MLWYERVVVLSVFLVAVVVYALGSRRWLATVLAGGLVFRLVVILVDSQLGILVEPPISYAHHERAALLAEAWLRGNLHGLPEGPRRVCRFCVENIDPMRRLVAYFLAPFYVIFGSWEISGRLAVAFYGTLSGYVTYRIARRIASARTATIAAALVVFWPSVVFRSVMIQREIIIATAMLGVVLLALRWTRAIHLEEVVLLLAIFGVLFVLRKENLPIVVLTLAVVPLIRSQNGLKYAFTAALLSFPFLAYFALNFGQFTGIGTALSPETPDM